MPRPRMVDDRQLLDAAMFTFWAKGYGGSSTRALEEATGLPASSLYLRYGNKEGLFAAALTHYIARVVDTRIARFLAAEDAAAGLREFFTSVYRARGPYHACLMANTWTELGTRVPAVAAILAQGNARLRAAFADNLRRGQARGAYAADLEPDSAALYLLTALQGLLATARGVRDHAELDAVVDTVLRALAPASGGVH